MHVHIMHRCKEGSSALNITWIESGPLSADKEPSMRIRLSMYHAWDVYTLFLENIQCLYTGIYLENEPLDMHSIYMPVRAIECVCNTVTFC